MVHTSMTAPLSAVNMCVVQLKDGDPARPSNSGDTDFLRMVKRRGGKLHGSTVVRVADEEDVAFERVQEFLSRHT